MLPDELERRLRPYPLDPLRVVVGPDEDADVDELLPAQLQLPEEPSELDHLGLYPDVHVLPGEPPPPGDRQVPKQTGGAEEQGVEVLARRAPDVALQRHVGRLGLPLPRGLDAGDAHEGQEPLCVADDICVDGGRPLSIPPRLLGPALLQRGLVPGPGLPPRLAPLPDDPPLELVGPAVEDVGDADARLHEVRVPVDQPAEVAGDPALSVLERPPVSAPYDRQELVEDVVAVEGYAASSEVVDGDLPRIDQPS